MRIGVALLLSYWMAESASRAIFFDVSAYLFSSAFCVCSKFCVRVFRFYAVSLEIRMISCLHDILVSSKNYFEYF